MTTPTPHDRQMELLYKRWLVERVLIHGESTLGLARLIKADPKDTKKDFEAAIGKDWRDVARGSGGQRAN